MSDSQPWADGLGDLDPLFQEAGFRRLIDSVDQDPLPSRIGEYELVEELGRGGMGSVWRGRQSEPIERDAAIKLIRPNRVSSEFVRRFEEERRVLARMDHPGIPRVFEVGTQDGVPFLIMELVNGLPINEYCRRNRLTLRERLALFVETCLAVQHAHEQEIIHRDLKPSNILVAQFDGAPHVKIIDFGLARLAEPEVSAQPDSRTLSSGAGTFEYMSPEQAIRDSREIDIRTDVYSLGVILYELLTGTTPVSKQTVDNAATSDVIKLICTQEPQPPSQILKKQVERLTQILEECGISQRKLMWALELELDWVVTEAISKHPRDRYESAKALADDVERFLADQDTLARRPKLLPRIRKSIRRNRVRFLAGLVVLAAFVVGAVFGVVNFGAASDSSLLFNTKDLAAAPERSKALLRFLESQRAKPTLSAQSLVNDSRCRDKIGLFQAQLQGVSVGYDKDFTGLCLKEANLREAAMSNCYFGDSILVQADLTDASLNGADFSSADLTEAICKRANFHNASFLSANFAGCDLGDARLEGACLATVTNWRGAILSGANLDRAVVASADWIDEVAKQIHDPQSLERWTVEQVPENVELPDRRYDRFQFWIRPRKNRKP